MRLKAKSTHRDKRNKENFSFQMGRYVSGHHHSPNDMGVHNNPEGKIAIFPVESIEYKKLSKDKSLEHVKAMRFKRIKQSTIFTDATSQMEAMIEQ
jgi:hypothetical protein